MSPSSRRLPPPDPQPGGVPGLLSRATAALSMARTPDEVASTLLKLVGEAYGGRCWLAGYDPETETATWLPERDAGPLRLDVRDGPLWKALREGREVMVPLRPDGTTRAFLPLMAAGQAAGCLVLEGRRAAFSPETLPALRALMPAGALSLRAALLQQALDAGIEERTGELTLLYDVSRSLGFVLSPEDLADLVATSLHRALPHDLCVFTTLGPEGAVSRVRLWAPCTPATTKRLQRLAIQEARRLSGRRLTRSVLEVAGPDDSPREPALGPAQLRAVAHAPLAARGDIMGLLTVASRDERALGEGPIRLLRTVASQASLTLDRLRMAREEESRKIHSMLESMADGVLLLDAGLRVVLSNPAAQRHLEALHPSGLPRSIDRLGDVSLAPLLQAEGASTFEIESVPDGRIYSATCSPVKASSPGVRGLVVVLSDVTDARRMQAQLSQNERLSALGEMISGVAHELNNPLATVMGLAQRLQDLPVENDVRSRLVTIGSEASRCQRIVQNLLHFARPHSPEHAAVDVNAGLDAVIQLLGHQLEADDIEVRRHLEPALPTVAGDRHLLHQVFLNLIHNAHQAMREQGSGGVLTLTTRRKDDRVIAEVADDGPGIPVRNLPRIFDPFFSTKEVGKGTGLGLSLAYATVQKHGGVLSVRSRPGEGAVFTVDLPAGDVQAEAPAVAAGVEASPAIAPRDLAGRKVLLVEDEGPLAEVMAEVLQAHGMAVEIAGDGRTARTRLSEASYDVIISDLKMPRMSGRELYRQVAAAHPELARRIIFSTGDTASPETQAFFDEVGNPWLSKPFNLQDLILAVQKVLG
ncbi:MAG: ATP-binding protein [Candidatus Polarisedimenticolia bacterium]